jgi:hypothetical protein
MIFKNKQAFKPLFNKNDKIILDERYGANLVLNFKYKSILPDCVLKVYSENEFDVKFIVKRLIATSNDLEAQNDDLIFISKKRLQNEIKYRKV